MLDGFSLLLLYLVQTQVRFDNARTLIERLGQMLKRERIPHLVLLDTGMIAELSAQDKDNLVHFFKAVTCKDGAMLARRILAFAPDQPCEVLHVNTYMGRCLPSVHSLPRRLRPT